MERLWRLRLALTHPWRIGQANQNALGAEQTSNGLAPWLFLCFNKRRVAPCFQLLPGKKGPGSLDRKPRFPAYLRRSVRIRRRTRLSSSSPFPSGEQYRSHTTEYTIGELNPSRDEEHHFPLQRRYTR